MSAPPFTPDDVTAIVVAYESAGVLPACVAALRAEGVRVLVVDNASTDGSAGWRRRSARGSSGPGATRATGGATIWACARRRPGSS